MLAIMETAVTLTSIESARKRIADTVRCTPLERSRWLSRGSDVFLKLECFQVTGSFKFRGAMSKLTSLSQEQLSQGILTVSAGNHGLAVAQACELLGAGATIIVPETASRAKIEAIERYGVELIKRGANYDEAERAAREEERRCGKVFVSPYNDSEVIAGQGTIAIEMLAQRPDLDAIIVPAGGGGLLAGVLIGAKSINPSIRVYGVEPAATPTTQRALEAGRIVEIEEEPTIADGLAGNIEPDSMTFPIIQRLIDGVILVGETPIRRAIANVANNDHIIIEGSAATAVAAVTAAEDNPRLKGRKVAAIVTGRNISINVFLEVLKDCLPLAS